MRMYPRGETNTAWKDNSLWQEGLGRMLDRMQTSLDVAPDAYQWFGNYKFSNEEFRVIWDWAKAQRETHSDW